EWRATYSRYGGGSEEPRLLGAPRWTATDATVHFREPPRSVSSRSGYSSILVLHGAADQPAQRQLALFQRPDELRAAALAHARFDEPSSADFATWVYAAREAPELPAILAARLGARGDVELLRLEQDLAGDAREEVCARHRALASESPTADHLYLATRCIADPRARAEATLDAYAQHTGHPFLAFAGGMALASRGQREEALAALERARARPSVAAHAALSLARLRRWSATSFATLHFDALTGVSPELDFRLALERGDEWVMQGDLRAYALLARGELEAALAAARGTPEVHDDVTRLAAASDGASERVRAAALALPADRGIDPLTVWSAIALATRHGGDAASLVAAARELYDDAIVDAMLPWADPSRLRDEPDALVALVDDLVFPLRAHARVMALVVLDGDVPPEWRHEARAALFASERPYFR
ncbi:MAG: hypothetical protein KF901_13525, partial [Myxococcales bacterium]|nr:hypothetical protein [Myxococcales bacterium]